MRLNKIIIIFFFCFFNTLLFSQEKVNWILNYNSNTKNIEITADIAEGWHLYSQSINPEIGPIPTQFSFTNNDKIEFIGKVEEPKPIVEFDENFEAMLEFFKGKVLFSQKINLKDATLLELQITFMVCNETMCLPPTDKKLSIEIKK